MSGPVAKQPGNGAVGKPTYAKPAGGDGGGLFGLRLPKLPALPDIGGPIKSFISGLTGGHNNNKPSYYPNGGQTTGWGSGGGVNAGGGQQSGQWAPVSPDSSYGPPTNAQVRQPIHWFPNLVS